MNHIGVHPFLTPNRLRLPSSLSDKKEVCLCKLCDCTDWQDNSFKHHASQIMDGEPIVHRKLWEFTQLMRTLENQNLLHENSIGLSVAAGSERVLFHLTNYVDHLVATDLYGDGAFANGEASEGMLRDPSSYAPCVYRPEALSTLYMDGCSLAFPDNTFDFAFCLSSLEHFGGLSTAKKCVQEMARVVRPGGVVFLTTECSLNGFVTDEVFKPCEILALLDDTNLTSAGAFDWGLSEESRALLLDMRKDDLTTLPHINLKHLSSIFTSISVAGIKTGNERRQSAKEDILEQVESLKVCPRQPIQHRKSFISFILKKFLVLKWKAEERVFVRQQK